MGLLPPLCCVSNAGMTVPIWVMWTYKNTKHISCGFSQKERACISGVRPAGQGKASGSGRFIQRRLVHRRSIPAPMQRVPAHVSARHHDVYMM